jgi:hypothetical protein
MGEPEPLLGRFSILAWHTHPGFNQTCCDGTDILDAEFTPRASALSGYPTTTSLFIFNLDVTLKLKQAYTVSDHESRLKLCSSGEIG